MKGLVIFFAVVVVSCDSFSDSSLQGVRRASVELQSGTKVGITYPSYTEKLTRLASELQLCDAPKVKLLPYKEALEIYQEAHTVWKLKLSGCSADLHDCDHLGEPLTVQQIAMKHGVRPTNSWKRQSDYTPGKEVETNFWNAEAIISACWRDAEAKLGVRE